MTLYGRAPTLPIAWAANRLPLARAVSGSGCSSQDARKPAAKASPAPVVSTTRGASHVARVLPAHAAPYARHLIEKVPPDLSRFLIAPMPGLLVRLDVGAGDAVEAGQPLAVVEAMKMENILRAEKAATVARVNAAEGESLAVDAVILELE